MKKILFFPIFLAFILISILFISVTLYASEEDFLYTHSFTKAICDDNFCEDYEIVCKNKNILSMSATGFAVQFAENWEDPRTEEMFRKSDEELAIAKRDLGIDKLIESE